MSASRMKRPDIQTLRALAISAVLAFHLRPDLFPLGYLGVDVFFVISGYLMAMMLHRVEKLTAKEVFGFYWRRISRIIPLYAVVICAVVIVARFILAPIDYARLAVDTRWSLAFAANSQQFIDSTDYWTEVNESPILLHMWSLGAEVQYYLIVPLLALLQRYFKRHNQEFEYLGFMAFGAPGSFLSFSLSSTNAAFLFMPNRIWQFSVGSIAYAIFRAQDEEHGDGKGSIEFSRCHVIFLHVTARIKSIVFIVLLCICCAPFQVSICLPVQDFEMLKWRFVCLQVVPVFLFRVFVNLGNASYSLYLVHWPVITLYKYACDMKILDFAGVSFCLLTSVCISIFAYRFIELNLASASRIMIVIAVTSLYAVIFVVTSFELSAHLT
ncbi:hypothetical protein PMAYCL1PPCAC_16561, partial [Pristionchus mayeri]